MDLAKRLVYLREQRGITTNKLANLSGVSQSHLREIELGTRNPTVETLSYFCEALGVTLSDFFADFDVQLNPFLISALRTLSNEQQQKLADFIVTVKQ